MEAALMVEDDDAIQSPTRAMLERTKCRAFDAPNSERAEASRAG